VQKIKRERNLTIAVYNAMYNAWGEFSMVKAAAERGWIDEKAVVLESLTAITRAGANVILTYWAKDVARWLS